MRDILNRTVQAILLESSKMFEAAYNIEPTDQVLKPYILDYMYRLQLSIKL